jgi:tetratricopeptide (TPR) repeat protein
MNISLHRRRWLAITLISVLIFIPIQNAYSTESTADSNTGLWQQAEDLKMAGYYDRAIPYIEKVLASQKAEPDGEKAELAKTLDYLGELKYLAGHYADAEPLLMESLLLSGFRNPASI